LGVDAQERQDLLEKTRQFAEAGDRLAADRADEQPLLALESAPRRHDPMHHFGHDMTEMIVYGAGIDELARQRFGKHRVRIEAIRWLVIARVTQGELLDAVAQNDAAAKSIRRRRHQGMSECLYTDAVEGAVGELGMQRTRPEYRRRVGGFRSGVP